MLKNIWGKIPEVVRTLLIISIGVSLVFLMACSAVVWKNYPQDNIVEELIEEAIKSKTSLEIDLSPSTPEWPKNSLLEIQRLDRQMGNAT